MKAPVSDLVAQALAYPPTLSATYWLCRMLIKEEIPGDFVECGVFCGAECAVMARAITDAYCTTKRVHLFDSFQGIPHAGQEDNDLRPTLEAGSRSGRSSGVSVQTVDQVKQHMTGWGIDPELLVYHEGWFEDTIPGFSQPIALLRLDCDLYESYRICLEHLHPLVSKGGWVVCDDFQLDGARKAVQEMIEPETIYWQRNR